MGISITSRRASLAALILGGALSFPALVAADFDPAAYRQLAKLGELELTPEQELEALPCAPLSPAELQPRGPHQRSRVIYFSNQLARQTIAGANGGPARLPVGAVIVKEKWTTRADQAPAIITVMIKLADRPGIGSWSFAMYDAATARDLTADYHQRRKTSCVDCHREWEKTDFISPEGFAFLNRPAGAAKP
jgi:hypothetical protein